MRRWIARRYGASIIRWLWPPGGSPLLWTPRNPIIEAEHKWTMKGKS